ncbi:MAG: C25 family cysteine peptidase [Candidatus Competibacteraceae bacterium]
MTASKSEFEMPIPFGVFADTGQPLDAIDDAALTAFVEQGPEPEQDYLEAKIDNSAHYGVIGDVEGNDLAQAGWAVMWAPGVDPKIEEALQPLLEHRRAQVGDETLFKSFEGATGYQPGDTAKTWLARQKVRMDVVDPALGVPYYLLIVAPPEAIPFEFQYSLDIYWAVGRLWFSTADEFRHYADSVVRYETMPEAPTARQIAVFAPQHDFDEATQSFCKQVATPLANGIDTSPPLGQRQKFALQSFIGDPATKNTLNAILTGAIPNGAPALLFSGSHGMVFRPDDSRQTDQQGAMVCQDWGGYGAITAEQWYAASDLPAQAKVHGLIHFLFACYGAGWPQFDNFNRRDKVPRPIAPKPLLGRLPQALLAHPNGGALAVIGHIDRAWAYSFQSDKSGPQTQGFRDVIGRLLRGERLGQATDQFNIRWACLSTDLADLLDRTAGLELMERDKRKMAQAWVARDDARNYIIFGDPAVKLRTDDMPVL